IGLGAQFFIIMVCMLFIFQVINIIIVRVCGPENVTAYNIAYKYFNILNMAMMIIVTPFWSACADAYTKKDFLWMKNVIEKMEMIWKLSICVLIIMILVSSTFYDIWVGDSVKISLSLSVMVGVYILVQNLCGIYIYMINGTSKIRLQLVVYLVSAFISVPTMYFLCSKYGITVMLLVPISVCLIQAFVAKKQLTKIIRGTASGIWIK
ncbi:MATE family efflux transporter, partial [Phocaeicola vulgatus]|nr:MATE family efflux transporter [Phocaeicola vulgatus]